MELPNEKDEARARSMLLREVVRISGFEKRVMEGEIHITPAALLTLEGQFGSAPVLACLRRYTRGDWEDMDEADFEANIEAIKTGARVLSAFCYPHVPDSTTVWFCTDAGHHEERATTHILLPEEYGRKYE